MSGFAAKLKRRFQHLRLKPIRVFCFHQVSDVFEPETMWKCDWTQTDVFKSNILTLKEKYNFISLKEAYNHIAKDKFRLKHYAALTADDGWASLKNIIPWLVEQKIPVTLFLNPLYLDGVHCQSRVTDKLLTAEDVTILVKQYAPFVTIASHGWSHEDCVKMTMDEFENNVMSAETVMENMEGKTPFYAFTFGRRKMEQVVFLNKVSLVPVLVDGRGNYNNPICVHRECIDGESFF